MTEGTAKKLYVLSAATMLAAFAVAVSEIAALTLDNMDGSLTGDFQSESSGADRGANWLPALKAGSRLHWPQDSNPSVPNGTWTPPQVVKVQ